MATMTAIKGIDLKTRFKEFCDRAFNGESFIISRPQNENVVLMSEKEYVELEKHRRNAEYLARLDRAFAQKKAGTMTEHDLIEV